MAVGPAEFREALKKFASGVTVVTTAHAGEKHGLTASSFASVSLDPPLVLVVLNTESKTHDLLNRSKMFCVNILGDHQQEIAAAFAEKGEKPFGSVPHREGAGDIPIFNDSIAWLECSLEAVFPGGTHEIVVGRVEACGGDGGGPLIYYERAYRSLKT